MNAHQSAFNSMQWHAPVIGGRSVFEFVDVLSESDRLQDLGVLTLDDMCRSLSPVLNG